MRRTQIYLSDKQHAALAKIAKASHQKKSEIIRAATDSFVGRPPEQDDWKKGIMAAFGM